MANRLRHVVARNIFWNWAGMLVDLAAGFIIAPFLVRRLGVTDYGLWIVIGSLTGYFSLVDLGLRAAVGRHLALERARNDWSAVNSTLSSALAMFAVMGAIAVVVYEKLGVMILKRTWFNLDLLWAGALVGAGLITLVV